MNPISPIEETHRTLTAVAAAGAPRPERRSPQTESQKPLALQESRAVVRVPPGEADAPEAPDETRRAALEARVAEANERVAASNLSIRIAWDDSWEHVVVQVLDDADQVVDQFPSEEFLEATRERAVPSGLLFDRKG